MPQAGLLVQIDGSPHDWLEDRGSRLTLVGAIDDATGTIVAATFADHEDGRAYRTILARMCRAHGVPAAVYRGPSGSFAPTQPGGPLGDAGTQVGRALAELGIASVPAASAQAKGRVERLWGTCQDRLVSELRLAGATDLETANAVLERFIGRFNANFAVSPTIPTPAWRPAPSARELARICAFRWSRVVGNDNTVRVEGAVLQLPPSHGGAGPGWSTGRGRAPPRRPAPHTRSRADPARPAGLARPPRAARRQTPRADRSEAGLRWHRATGLPTEPRPSLEPAGAEGPEPTATDRITEQMT
jgi:hypothetical protein